MNSLVFMSPSKAFNMPGLASSYAIIENDELRHRFQVYMEAGEFSEGHLFAYLSVAARTVMVLNGWISHSLYKSKY